MSASSKTSEITGAIGVSGWAQIDPAPLAGRKYVDLANNTNLGQAPQRIAIIFSSFGAPTGVLGTGFVLEPGAVWMKEPAEPTVGIYARAATGAPVTGEALMMCEWSA